MDEIRNRGRNQNATGRRRPSTGRSTGREGEPLAQDEPQEMTDMIQNDSEASKSPSHPINHSFPRQPSIPQLNDLTLPLASLRPVTPIHHSQLTSSSLKKSSMHQTCPIALRHPAFDPPVSPPRQQQQQQRPKLEAVESILAAYDNVPLGSGTEDHERLP